MSDEVQGGCVAAVLVIVAFAVVFAVSDTVGILLIWGAGVVLLWRAVDKQVPDSSAPPPPVEAAPLGDVYAGETGDVDRVERGPEGVMFTVHPRRIEVRRDHG